MRRDCFNAACRPPLDRPLNACEKAEIVRGTAVPTPKTTTKRLTDGQLAYETKRAAKAGMSLDKWLGSKQRQQEADAKAKLKAAEAAKPPKPPGFFGRLLERAQRPFGS